MSRARDIANLQSSKITADFGIDIDNITIDGTEIDLSSGNLTIDVAGQLVVNSDSGQLVFQDDTDNIGELANHSGDFGVNALGQDKHILFKGNQKFRTFTASNGVVLGLGENTGSADLIRLDARSTTPNDSYINSGNVGIGTDAPSDYNSAAHNLVIYESGGSGMTLASGTSGQGAIYFADGTSGDAEYRGYIIYEHGSNDYMRFGTAATERMRIHSDGSVTIGKTAANNSAAGISMFGTTGMSVTRDGGVPFICHRRTNDGTLIQFRKDDGTVGYIAYQGAELQVGQGNASLQFSNSADAIVPANENGTANDDDIDLGISSGRFDNIFATNGTIQTSDENEKQDIASMTTAELAVGKRLSTLFKTFRWKSKVTKKADKARTHSGIVAQEVKEDFEAEGLDATKYALFCSDTWTNDDGDEQTRLGVRYPELLSFIASYNESRFTAIEARLAKLEG